MRKTKRINGKIAPPPDLLTAVEAASRARGERMTDVRRETLDALAGAKTPLSAYRLLAAINKKRAKPLSAMSLYRALDYLVSLGFALKIDSTNAFALCRHGTEETRDHVVLVCDKCGRFDEVHDDAAFSSLKKIAEAHGHALRNHAVEIHGLCGKCV